MSRIGEIWHQPSAADIADANDTKLRLFINQRYNIRLSSYWDLHRFSIEQPNAFWTAVWVHTGCIGEIGEVLFDGSRAMDSAEPTVNAKVNLAENMLLGHPNARSNKVLAVVGVTEPSKDKPREPTFLRQLTFAELYDEVRRAAYALRQMGVKRGDVVAAYTPNNVEALVVMLAALSFGAVFTSVSLDFGVSAVLDRFQQCEPVVLLTASNYAYNGKTINVLDKVESIAESLARAKLRHVIVVDQLSQSREVRTLPSKPANVKHHSWRQFLAQGDAAPQGIAFTRLPAEHACYVNFSSGTTGKPKAIIHQTGGQLLGYKLSRTYHGGLKPGDLELQYTSTSWMMHCHTTMSLLVGAGYIAYDGSPLVPQSVLWDIVDRFNCTTIGVSPRYLAVLEGSKYYPCERHSLKSIRGIGTTGAPLRPEQYAFIRDRIFNGTTKVLTNGSGGTDISGPFVSAVASLPIRIGEIQAPVLGMQVQAWDEQGRPVYDEQGQMIIAKPFPNQPLGFVGDENRKKLKETYFSTYRKPVWDQADFISCNSQTGGYTIYGRADGTLNPSGVRFGSSELYNVVEQIEAIDDSLAIGHKQGGEERVLLFIKTRDGKPVSSELEQRIKKDIAAALSTRHVPALIIGCPDIPYNATGKKMEVPVKKLLNGADRKTVNTSACANPESLDFYRADMAELRTPRAKL